MFNLISSHVRMLREHSEVEMQSSGPVTQLGPKFRPARAFCGARTKNAGLMPDSEEAITVYYAIHPVENLLMKLRFVTWCRTVLDPKRQGFEVL